MKKYDFTSSSSMVINQLVDIINSLSLDTTTSVVQDNATEGCQHFSMRQYVADIREKDPKACNPFGEKNYRIWEQLKAPLDVPQFKWWRCTNCVRDIVASSTPGLPELQETSQRLNAQLSSLHFCASVEHRASRDAEREGRDPQKELARVATLLKENETAKGVRNPTLRLREKRPCLSKDKHIIITEVKDNLDQSSRNGQANANHSKTRFSRQEFVRPVETENAKRPSPFSQNADLISRKRSKSTGESSCPHQDKQKETFKRSGTGPNPLVRKMYNKLAARYMSESSTHCVINKKPADVSVRDPWNNYMFQNEDLKRKNSGKRRRDTN